MRGLVQVFVALALLLSFNNLVVPLYIIVTQLLLYQ